MGDADLLQDFVAPLQGGVVEVPHQSIDWLRAADCQGFSRACLQIEQVNANFVFRLKDGGRAKSADGYAKTAASFASCKHQVVLPAPLGAV